MFSLGFNAVCWARYIEVQTIAVANSSLMLWTQTISSFYIMWKKRNEQKITTHWMNQNLANKIEKYETVLLLSRNEWKNIYFRILNRYNIDFDQVYFSLGLQTYLDEIHVVKSTHCASPRFKIFSIHNIWNCAAHREIDSYRKQNHHIWNI